MYSKIVDIVAVSPNTNPLKGGKCERWWRENSDEFHGLDKKSMNRKVSGRTDPGTMSPTVVETLKTFQFKGFEFGNWLSQSERYDVFRAFQFCLADMYAWLGTYNLGIKNSIGVAFGARGSGHALAHFESRTNMVNMTKTKGAGSLLHEYAHAIDYTIGFYLDQCARYAYLSGGHSLVQTDANVGGQFRAMLNKILIYARDTESYKKMAKSVNKIEYWGNSTEMFARLTEAYYAYYYNSKNNYYLANTASYYESLNKKYGIYLSRSEMDVIKPELDKFWKEVGLLLNDKCKVKATPYPKDKSQKKEKNAPKAAKSFSIEYRVYTDKTFKKVKKVERSKVIFENKPLDTLLEHLNRIEKDAKADIINKYKNTFISRTQYSIRYLTFKGEYYEEVIVDSNGNRLKEKKAPVPKKKEMKQKPIQF